MLIPVCCLNVLPIYSKEKSISVTIFELLTADHVAKCFPEFVLCCGRHQLQAQTNRFNCQPDVGVYIFGSACLKLEILDSHHIYGSL